MNKIDYKPLIFISRPDIPPSALEILRDCDLDIWDQDCFVPRETFLKKISGKHALFIHSHDKIDKEALNAAGNNLKVIGTMSAGYDHIDIEEAKRRNIKIGYTSGVLNDAVADLAMALVLCVTRRLFEGHKQVLEGKWKTWSRWSWMNGFGLKNSIIGIFGFGNIGLEIAKRLVPFKPSKILYTSRTVKEEANKLGAIKVNLDDLLKKSDIIILISSLNEDTKGIINEEKIKLMKKTSYLINVSRGGVINQESLVKALKEKKIGGAALDVTTPEPLPTTHELLKLDNCCKHSLYLESSFLMH